MSAEPIVVVLSRVINAQGEKSATLTLYPDTEDERSKLLDAIATAIGEGVALDVKPRSDKRRILVNPVHVMYAE